MPTLTSMTTRQLTPLRWQVWASGSICTKWSQATIGSAERHSETIRSSLGCPTIMLAIITSRMPAAAITSASETLPQVTPMAPVASCWSAIVGDLWHFMCGRHCLPRAAMNPAIAVMFRSIADKLRHKRGVSRLSFCEPISGCMREVSKS